MASTQQHLPISDIKDDVVTLKDGSMAVILRVSTVNFGLLSENEQLAIIASFAGLLNSLSFMIQIIIRSKKLDISTYLSSLDVAQSQQKNPLLYSMIGRYKAFIKSTVAENEVLDKSFYIAIPVSGLELGPFKNAQNSFKKALTALYPRRDNIIRQLSRIGLKADQLDTQDLIKLFYDIYNEPLVVSSQSAENQIPSDTVNLGMNEVENLKSEEDSGQARMTITPPAPVPQPRMSQPLPQIQPQTKNPPPPYRRRSPYIVEELPEDYASV
jgi:hypothetical protein